MHAVRKFSRWLFTVFIRLFFTLTILFKSYFLYLFPHFLPRHIFPIPHNDLYRLTCYPQYSFHYYPSVTYSSHYLAVTYYRSDSRYLLTIMCINELTVEMDYKLVVKLLFVQ